MSYSDEDLRRIWAKGKIVSADNLWRKDVCDAFMYWPHYGNRNSEYGWEVDHIVPIARGGGEDLSNLRPLHWENNASRQDGKLVCAVKSNGQHNVHIYSRR
jgi:hypothetical protein